MDQSAPNPPRTRLPDSKMIYPSAIDSQAASSGWAMKSSEAAKNTVTKNVTSRNAATFHRRRSDRVSKKMIDEAEKIQAKKLNAVIREVVYEMVNEIVQLQDVSVGRVQPVKISFKIKAKELDTVIRDVVYGMVDEIVQMQDDNVGRVLPVKIPSKRKAKELNKVAKRGVYSRVGSVGDLTGGTRPGLEFVNTFSRLRSPDFDPLLEGVVEAGWTEHGKSHSSLPGHQPRLLEGLFQFTGDASGRSVKSAKLHNLPLPAGAVLDDAKTFEVNDGKYPKLLSILSHDNLLRQQHTVSRNEFETAELTDQRLDLAIVALNNGDATTQISRFSNSSAHAEMTKWGNELRASTIADPGEGSVASVPNFNKLTNVNLPITLNSTQLSATHALVNDTHPGNNFIAVAAIVSDLETHYHKVFAMESKMDESKDEGDFGVGQTSSGDSQGKARGDNNGSGLNTVAANLTLNDTLDDTHGDNDDNDKLSSPAASIALDDELDEMFPTINSSIHAAPLSLPSSSSCSDSMSVSTLPNMTAALESQNISHQYRFVNSSDPPSDSSDNDAADTDVVMSGMSVNNVSDAKNRRTSNQNESHQREGLTYNRAKIDKDEFELSENDEHTKAIVRKNRYDGGDRGKASKWWWTALKNSRIETNAYAARKQEYKEALIIQCEYVERLEEENVKLGKLQKENTARITALEKELKKKSRAHK